MKIEFFNRLEKIDSLFDFIRSKNKKYIIAESDENNRTIEVGYLENCQLCGYNNHYPNPLIYSEYYDNLILPTNERFMSLKSGTIYEETMSYKLDVGSLNPTKRIIEPVFYFIYNTDNYFHFLYDSIPYLYSYFYLKQEISNLKLLMNYNFGKSSYYPFVMDTLELFDIHKKDIIIHKETNKYDKIFIGSSLTHDGKSNSPPRKEVYDIFNGIKNKINKEIYPEKIYISRRTWKHSNLSNIGTNYTMRRKLINEDYVVDLLEKYGFKEIFCENLSMLEKISLFENAKHIIGPIGGGMCNILFCNKETKITVLNSPMFMEINNRFKYSMEHCDVNYINGKFLDDSNIIRENVRVKIINKNNDSYDKIGEIVKHIRNDEYIIRVASKTTTGLNYEDSLDETLFKRNEFETIDEGLNSPWIIDINELESEL